MTKNINVSKKKSRGPKTYWVEKNGSLYARLQYINEQGEHRDKYKSITDKRNARSEVEKMRRELTEHSEETLHSDKMTFAEVAKEYDELELIAAVYRNGEKIKGRKSIAPVKAAIKPLIKYFGTKPVRAIKPIDLKHYKNKRLDEPVEKEVKVKTKVTDPLTGIEKTVITKVIRSSDRALATVNRELSWMRAILNFAMINDWLIKNPFDKVKGIIATSAEVERDRILSFEEEESLLKHCTEERTHLRPIIICGVDTAMRKNEILKTQWKNVNLETGEIYIPKETSKTGYDRSVGITKRLRKELEAIWEKSPQRLGDLVFGIKADFSNGFETARSKAGLVDFRFHDCRHTGTTRMIRSGSPHMEVMKITGHKQLSTFLRYLNIKDDATRKCALNLDTYLEQSQSIP